MFTRLRRASAPWMGENDCTVDLRERLHCGWERNLAARRTHFATMVVHAKAALPLTSQTGPTGPMTAHPPSPLTSGIAVMSMASVRAPTSAISDTSLRRSKFMLAPDVMHTNVSPLAPDLLEYALAPATATAPAGCEHGQSRAITHVTGVTAESVDSPPRCCCRCFALK